MPESEPKPRPLEAVAPGSGQGWKAVLKNGKQVVVHEIPVAPATAAAAAPRLQRLAEHPHPSLSPILAWGTEASGVWVAVEPNEGTPLSAVLPRGRFTPHAAAALGTAVLSGVAALHEAGVAMGGFDAGAIRLTGNGEVRLAGHPVAAVRGAPSQGDLRADVRSCGMAICAAFGVDPSGAPAPPELPPGLVVTMRSMASGAMGPAVDRAQGALREMVGPLLAPDRQMAAQSELALRAGGREMPSITPFIPDATKPVAQDTPLPRAASYEPPPRPVETYSGLPAYQAPPAAPAPAPTPPAPVPMPAEAAPPPAPTPPPQPAAPPQAPAYTSQPPAPAYTSQPPAPATWEPQPTPPAPAPAFASAPPPVVSTPPEPAPSAQPVEPAPPATYPPSAPAVKPQEMGSGGAAWSPLQTSEWTPGPAPSGRVSSSEWTGEATPVPAPVPAELRSAPSAAEPAPAETPAIPRAAAPKPARKPAPRRPASDMPSGRPAWLVPAAIGVVVLLLLGGVGAYLATRGGSTTSQATASPHPSPSAKTQSPTPTNQLQQVPVYAPSAAAPVGGVHFCTAATPCVAPGLPNATDTNCTLGGPCSVDVGIFYSPTYGGPVSYILKFFDRCTGTTTDLPGRAATAGNSQFPKFSVSEVSTSVTLPAGAKSAALVAITQAPAVVASPPLLLGANSC